MTARYILAALLLLLPTIHGAQDQPCIVNSSEIGSSIIIVGKLGYPLGQMLSIECYTQGEGKDPQVIIEKVNEIRLSTAIEIGFYNASLLKLQPSTHYVLIGYETGGYDKSNANCPSVHAQKGFVFLTMLCVCEILQCS